MQLLPITHVHDAQIPRDTQISAPTNVPLVALGDGAVDSNHHRVRIDLLAVHMVEQATTGAHNSDGTLPGEV